MGLYLSQGQVYRLSIEIGMVQACAIAKYTDFDDYTLDMLDVWAHSISTRKWQFCNVYPNITLSTSIFPNSKKEA